MTTTAPNYRHTHHRPNNTYQSIGQSTNIPNRSANITYQEKCRLEKSIIAFQKFQRERIIGTPFLLILVELLMICGAGLVNIYIGGWIAAIGWVAFSFATLLLIGAFESEINNKYGYSNSPNWTFPYASTILYNATQKALRSLKQANDKPSKIKRQFLWDLLKHTYFKNYFLVKISDEKFKALMNDLYGSDIKNIQSLIEYYNTDYDGTRDNFDYSRLKQLGSLIYNQANHPNANALFTQKPLFDKSLLSIRKTHIFYYLTKQTTNQVRELNNCLYPLLTNKENGKKHYNNKIVKKCYIKPFEHKVTEELYRKRRINKQNIDVPIDLLKLIIIDFAGLHPFYYMHHFSYLYFRYLIITSNIFSYPNYDIDKKTFNQYVTQPIKVMLGSKEYPNLSFIFTVFEYYTDPKNKDQHKMLNAIKDTLKSNNSICLIELPEFKQQLLQLYKNCNYQHKDTVISIIVDDIQKMIINKGDISVIINFLNQSQLLSDTYGFSMSRYDLLCSMQNMLQQNKTLCLVTNHQLKKALSSLYKNSLSYYKNGILRIIADDIKKVTIKPDNFMMINFVKQNKLLIGACQLNNQYAIHSIAGILLSVYDHTNATTSIRQSIQTIIKQPFHIHLDPSYNSLDFTLLTFMVSQNNAQFNVWNESNTSLIKKLEDILEPSKKMIEHNAFNEKKEEY